MGKHLKQNRIWQVIYEYGDGRYLGTIENGGGGRHGRDVVHTEKNDGVEGRGTTEENVTRTTKETQ